MATIFPREEKPELLFQKILADPRACERLRETFYNALDEAEDTEGNEICGDSLSAEQFTKALFDAYDNKDLTAFLMVVCQHSMFDLLRNAYLAPFRFNADGQTNPYILTDEEGRLLPEAKGKVNAKEYSRFSKAFVKREKVKMYLACGYRKRHGYAADTMQVQEYRVEQHMGLLLIYELPNTVKQQETEAQAYAAVWDIMMRLQRELPRSVVYYGQDSLEDAGRRYDEMGVFLPLNLFSDRLEKNIAKADEIVYRP
ncbi:MAG: DUF4866 domain-containing protein [Oscillospiraceae bacterium]|jgi:hypothetical protein|nr:DUF4866 domain-containing protein [Oscillospiraceae bacterium]MDD3262008.1 DUF4866 domain-containing protein [Oscillospiraceae bacterium]